MLMNRVNPSSLTSRSTNVRTEGFSDSDNAKKHKSALGSSWLRASCLSVLMRAIGSISFGIRVKVVGVKCFELALYFLRWQKMQADSYGESLKCYCYSEKKSSFWDFRCYISIQLFSGSVMKDVRAVLLSVTGALPSWAPISLGSVRSMSTLNT